MVEKETRRNVEYVFVLKKKTMTSINVVDQFRVFLVMELAIVVVENVFVIKTLKVPIVSAIETSVESMETVKMENVFVISCRMVSVT